MAEFGVIDAQSWVDGSLAVAVIAVGGEVRFDALFAGPVRSGPNRVADAG